MAGAGVRQGCKNVGRRGGFAEGTKRCFLRGRRRDFLLLMSMFEADDAESVERLQISCHGSVTLQVLFRVAVTGVRMPRLNFSVAGAILSKHPLENR